MIEEQARKNENQYTKILLFSLSEEEGDEWEEDLGGWRHKATPVYRSPQGDWTEFAEHKSRWIYFMPKTIPGSPEPEDVNFPEWIECRWDSQAGRWVVMPSGGDGFDIRLRVDGANRVLEKTFDGTNWIHILTIWECNR